MSTALLSRALGAARARLDTAGRSYGQAAAHYAERGESLRTAVWRTKVIATAAAGRVLRLRAALADVEAS